MAKRAKKQRLYRVERRLSFAGKVAEAGEVRDDIPHESTRWLVERGHIVEVADRDGTPIDGGDTTPSEPVWPDLVEDADADASEDADQLDVMADAAGDEAATEPDAEPGDDAGSELTGTEEGDTDA